MILSEISIEIEVIQLTHSFSLETNQLYVIELNQSGIWQRTFDVAKFSNQHLSFGRTEERVKAIQSVNFEPRLKQMETSNHVFAKQLFMNYRLRNVINHDRFDIFECSCFLCSFALYLALSCLSRKEPITPRVLDAVVFRALKNKWSFHRMERVWMAARLTSCRRRVCSIARNIFRYAAFQRGFQ